MWQPAEVSPLHMLRSPTLSILNRVFGTQPPFPSLLLARTLHGHETSMVSTTFIVVMPLASALNRTACAAAKA